MGLRIDQIKTKKQRSKASFVDLLQQDISFNSKGINDKKKFNFYSELNMLLEAGVDVKNALDIMARSDQTKDAKLYKDLSNALMQGDSLSTALNAISGMNAYDEHTVAVGEETGKLAEVVKEMSQFYERKIELKRQMTSAFIYPVFVLVVTFGVVFFMLYSVVPMFQDMFNSFDAELPALTQKVIALSEWVQKNGMMLLLILLAIIFLLVSQKKKTWFRRASSTMLLKMGPLSKLLRKIYLTRFCQSMKLLVESDTPLNRSLKLSGQMINFYPYEQALKKVESEVVKGEAFNKSLQKHPHLFDAKFVSLIKVSEEYNQLDKMFNKLSIQYQSEVDVQSKILSKILEPTLMVFIAIIVGVILLSMYLPLFEISNVIG